MTLEEALKEIERLNKVVEGKGVAEYHYLQKIGHLEDHMRSYRNIAENLGCALKMRLEGK